MSAAPVKLRDPARRARFEAVTIRAKLPGPVWRSLARTYHRYWALEGAPDTLPVVEVEEGTDTAYVLTAHRWAQLQRYITGLEDRLEELEPASGGDSA